jgi:F-type H+/Na+-transporting ATPase subunit alpha
VKSLNQNERSPLAVEDQVAVVYAATNGFVDRINADRVAEFQRGLVERVHSEIPEVLKKIAEGDWSDETQKGLDDAVAQYAEDFGYDLDEEGHALTDEQAIQEGGRRSRQEEKEEDEGAETEEREEEEAGATA